MNRQYLFLSDFHEYIQLIREYNISLHVSTLIGSEKAVQCITAHKAKGLEYAHVYAIGLTEKQYKRGKNVSNPLPVNLALSPEKDNEDDIRRLIYTVCTRAKDRLVLSHARLTLNEKSDTPVSVLSNIEKWIYIKPQTSVELAPVLLETESRDITSLPYTWPESEFLRNILHRNFQLSVTALQNFLDISRWWPKYFLANNVLRFPKSKHESAIYGTSMHKALEDFFRDYTARRVFQKDILFQSFSTSLKKEGLEPSRERDFLDRGETHLKKLYEYITGREYGELHLEYRFTEGWWVHIPLKAEQKASESNLPSSIRLTGAIDRIELTWDGTMIITDYKTGDSLDSLDIKGSHWDRIKAWRYRMQLVFYALLFSRTPRWNPWTHRVFQLFFIECNTKTNTFHEITEYIQTSEIERLEQLIQVVMKHIYTLNFPDVSQYDQTIEGIRQFEEDLLN